MKTIKFAFLFMTMSLFFAACSNDDDNTPDPVNEEELITTITVTMIPEGGGDTVVLASRDLDGDGPNAPVVTVSGNFAEGTTYNGTIILLNETETPPENITTEVEEEDDEHQFFYVIGGNLDATTTYTNFDGDGNPLGTEFELVANTVSTGTINFILRHEPTKPNNGDPGVAGGETDISATFAVEIE